MYSEGQRKKRDTLRVTETQACGQIQRKRCTYRQETHIVKETRYGSFRHIAKETRYRYLYLYLYISVSLLTQREKCQSEKEKSTRETDTPKVRRESRENERQTCIYADRGERHRSEDTYIEK